jgi:ribosome-associated heat shock protein Hsp15
MSGMDSVRIDKWLWAARFFKTRSQAAKACELGRVTLHGQAAKPGREVRRGERVSVTTGGGEFHIEVLDLSDVRGGAQAAQALYRETEESKAARAKAAAERKAMAEWEKLPAGRPDKRDRQLIRRMRGRS